MGKYFNNNEGATLIVVLLVMVVSMILMTSLLSLSLSDTVMAVNQEKNLQAEYIAKAGVDIVAHDIISNPEDYTSEKLPKTISNTVIGEGSFSAEVRMESNDIVIESKGKVDDSNQTVTLEMLNDSSAEGIFENVIYANNGFDVSKMKIKGPLQSGGEIIAPNDYEYEVKPNEYNYYPSPNFTTPSGINLMISNKETITIDNNSEFPLIDINNGGTLTFDASLKEDNILHIKVNNFNNNGVVNIEGGKVFLYINNSMDIKTKGLVNNNNPSNLNIIVKDKGALYIQAKHDLKAFIYGPKSTITVNSGNITIEGAIIGNYFNDNNNATVEYANPDSDLDYGGILSIWQKKFYRN